MSENSSDDERNPQLYTAGEGGEADISTRVELPVGVSVGELRRRLPGSSVLMVSFHIPDDREELKFALNFHGKQREYILFHGISYRVNVNQKHGSDAEVFLNPATPKDGVPEESNIPSIVDELFSTEEGRKKAGGLKIYAESPDIDLMQFLDKIVQDNNSYSIYKEFLEQSEKISPQEIVKMIEEVAKEVRFVMPQVTETGYRLMYRHFATMAEYRYCTARETGEAVDFTEVMRGSARDYFEFIDKTLKERIPLLKEVADRDPNSIVMAFDIVPTYPDYLDEGDVLLTTYVPERGWTVSAPVDACPNLAVVDFDNFVRERGSTERMENFSNTAQQLIQDRSLTVDRERKLIIFKDRNALTYTDNASYHPGASAKQALVALNYTGDPIMAGSTYDYVIFRDDSEFDESSEKQNNITLDLTME
jgi:hypothetical protein